ncbi:MAG: hypothetical protein GXP03_15575 [Alphaproteobacteria bacterium]|nr:hypothetical protein [Alphaproteobacteria bacterium]
MKKCSILAALLLSLAGASATQAQVISDCDWEASAWNLVEPWAENSRTFSNGATRLAVLDTVEPAAGAMHLLILSPPYDPLAGRQCKVLSWFKGMGFAGLNFSDLKAGYDPSRGLLFELPVQIYDPETSFSNSAIVFFELNQATGVITTDIELGRE